MAVVYFSPFTNDTNSYIELQKRLLSELGYEVRPLSLAALAQGRCMGLLSRDNVVWVHWLETRAYATGPRGREISLRGMAQLAVYLPLLASARARVVYFVHNHALHDATAAQARLATSIVALLRKIAARRVVHDPTCGPEYGASYLPHPLYWDAPTSEPSRAPASPVTTSRPRFVVIGAIRAYKRIRELLTLWPHGAELLIAGKADLGYLDELRATVRERGLEASVTIDPRFLSTAEFRSIMEAGYIVILPHADRSMLVSGVFFEAVGKTPAILARRNSFFAWAERRFASVHCFGDDVELADKLQWLATQELESARACDANAARAQFGWGACQSAYGAFLASLRGTCSPSRNTNTSA